MINQANFPAIFNAAKSDRVSGKYQFVNTAEVVEALQGQGYIIRSVGQQGKGPSGKHLVRMTDSSAKVYGDSKLEVVLRNAHNGLSAFTMWAGVYRLVCSNGLVVGVNEIPPVYLRHVGEGVQDAVKDALMQLDERRQTILGNIDLMKNTTLDEGQTIQLANEALILAFGNTHPERVTEKNALLINKPRRTEDVGADVWRTFNRLQENLIRGGLRLEGMTRQLQGVRDLDRDLIINKGLWTASVESAKKAA